MCQHCKESQASENRPTGERPAPLKRKTERTLTAAQERENPEAPSASPLSPEPEHPEVAQLQRMWEGLQLRLPVGGPHALAHQGEAVQLHSVPQELHHSQHAEEAPPHPHRGKAFPLSRMWEMLQPVGTPQHSLQAPHQGEGQLESSTALQMKEDLQQQTQLILNFDMLSVDNFQVQTVYSYDV